jgi:hypothetical protein
MALGFVNTGFHRVESLPATDLYASRRQEEMLLLRGAGEQVADPNIVSREGEIRIPLFPIPQNCVGICDDGGYSEAARHCYERYSDSRRNNNRRGWIHICISRRKGVYIELGEECKDVMCSSAIGNVLLNLYTAENGSLIARTIVSHGGQ